MQFKSESLNTWRLNAGLGDEIAIPKQTSNLHVTLGPATMNLSFSWVVQIRSSN